MAVKVISQRLERPRAAVGRDRSEGATVGQDHLGGAGVGQGDVAGADEVPAGGLAVRNDGASGGSGPKASGDGVVEAHLSDDDGLDVPLCGAVVRRGVSGQPGSDECGELPKGGVLVFFRRDPPGGSAYARSKTSAAAAAAATAAAAAATATAAAADEARASALVEVADSAKTTDIDTPSPLLKPSDETVACVRRVLDLIRERDDCKDVYATYTSMVWSAWLSLKVVRLWKVGSQPKMLRRNGHRCAPFSRNGGRHGASLLGLNP